MVAFWDEILMTKGNDNVDNGFDNSDDEFGIVDDGYDDYDCYV